MRPVYPQPGYVEADTHLLLGSGQYAFADCYVITPKYGDPLYITVIGKDLTVVPPGAMSPVTYKSPSDYLISGLRLVMGTGINVDEQELTFSYTESAELMGLPFPRAIRAGRLDGSTITRHRFFAKSMEGPWVGGVLLFKGRMSSVDNLSRSGAVIKVKSELVLLNTNLPRHLYQPNCVHSLYDPGCGLNREDFIQSGAVQSGSTSQVINWSGSTVELSLGVIYLDSPGGITLVRTIREATSSQLRLAYPLDTIPTVGTTFDVYPGCNQTYERCGEFNNQEHFKGFPFLPVAETAI